MREKTVIKIRSIIAIILCCFLVGCGIDTDKSNENLYEQMSNEEKYMYLLEGMLDTETEETLYQSLDDLFIETHQEIAMLLDAEVMRYNYKVTDVGRKIIAVITQWLLDHKDDDNDGVVGWGAKKPRLATEKVSAAPANHVYAIQVAQVLESLMNAENTNAISESTRKEIRETIADVSVQWNEYYWTEKIYEGGYFWYSIIEADNVEHVNITAIMAGVFARAISEYGELFSDEEKELIVDHINKSMEAVVAQAKVSKGITYWEYSTLNRCLNDVVHVGFIFEGILNYEKYIGDVYIPWNKSEMLDIMKTCWDDKEKKLYDYPIEINPKYQSDRARMFSCGEYLLLLEKEDIQLSSDIIDYIEDTYHCWSSGALSEERTSENGYTLRELTFVIRGISSYLYSETKEG